jgi:sulfite reductase beta subunit-like hemoprotein
MRGLAHIIRRYCGGLVRMSIDQNLIVRWIKNEHVQSLFAELEPLGLAEEGKAEFGKNILKLPAKRIPDAVARMLELYRKDRTSERELFRAFALRAGVDYWKHALTEFETLPPYEQSPEAYRDWGAETEFSLGGMGPGECAA